MSTKTIYLGPLEFSGSEGPGWSFRELKGWFGATQNKERTEERPSSHGAAPRARVLRSGRGLQFDARFKGRTAADVEDAFDILAAVGAEGPVEMRVSSDGAETWRMVTIERSLPDEPHGLASAWASIEVFSADPRRYADAIFQRVGAPTPGKGVTWPRRWPQTYPGGGATGRLPLTNSGRAPSPATLRIGGGFDSALIAHIETGARVGFDRPVPSGDFIEIDVRNRRALYNGIPGSDVSRSLQYREWRDVPARATSTYQLDVTAAQGDPYLEGKVHSAWW